MLNMNTTQQHNRNSQTYQKLLEKANTSEFITDKEFKENEELFFPTINKTDMRAYIETEIT